MVEENYPTINVLLVPVLLVFQKDANFNYYGCSDPQVIEKFKDFNASKSFCNYLLSSRHQSDRGDDLIHTDMDCVFFEYTQSWVVFLVSSIAILYSMLVLQKIW
jgi:hypothetical protein